MKIKSGFELRRICGENILIAHGVENIDFTKVISLNESAADVWNALVGKDFTLDDMVAVILDNYEIDADTARQDCAKLLSDWRSVGCIED